MEEFTTMYYVVTQVDNDNKIVDVLGEFFDRAEAERFIERAFDPSSNLTLRIRIAWRTYMIEEE